MDENNKEENKEFTFITEKIKEKPVNKKKMAKSVLTIILLGLIFGVVSAISYTVGVHHMKDVIYPVTPEKINFDDIVSSDEAVSEDEVISVEVVSDDSLESGDVDEEEQEPMQQVIHNVNNYVEKVGLDINDYEKLYDSLYQIAKNASASIVQVKGVASDTDWFSNTYKSSKVSSGLIIANNKKELLILINRDVVSDAEEIHVIFPDGAKAIATEKKYDPNTNLAILAVELVDLKSDTVGSISMAKLSTFGAEPVGKNVIAVGSPLGVENSIAYGVITSSAGIKQLRDSDVHILTTDIYGSKNGSGVLVDLEGNVVGIISQSDANSDTPNIVKAYSIPDIKNSIERMSNGQDRAYLGIYGTDVTEEIAEEQGIPNGAYVTEIAMDSPAMDCGIQSGDVITMIGTTDVGDFKDFKIAMNKSQPGDETVITVKRYARGEYIEMTFDVVLGTLK